MAIRGDMVALLNPCYEIMRMAQPAQGGLSPAAMDVPATVKGGTPVALGVLPGRTPRN